jgi:type II secretory pathway pseudopilin PulG
MKERIKTKKYKAFTLMEMIVVMALIFIVFLAFVSVLTSMMRASNTVSARMVSRQEGEYISEVFRKFIRNASYDSIRVYRRHNPRITFSMDGEKVNYSHVINIAPLGYTLLSSAGGTGGTEIHFRPSGNPNEVVCMGFFEDTVTGRGYIIRSKVTYAQPWHAYNPNLCFSPATQDFRKNFMILNSDLIHIDTFTIDFSGGGLNNYYTFEMEMEPQLGVGGFSYYRDTRLPTYIKTFVVQTRAYQSW